MSINFDEVIDRRNTDSLKYDFAQKRGMPADILPLWVADMDFAAPPAVRQALADRAAHGIFGYSDAADDSYYNALSRWYSERFDWQVRPEWLIKTPGVVFALCAAIRALTHEGDAVLIQPPVYYPFSESILENNRKLVTNQLVYADGRYSVDLADFERQIVTHGVKLFMLCSPHNPVGRVWTEAELTAMGDICVKHGVYIVADEIHADFVYPDHHHLVFANLKPAFSDIAITCTAPSKTFNLAGLQISNIFVANADVRRCLRKAINRVGYSQPNVMGLIACRAAYAQGAEWLDALKTYLSGNLAFVRHFLAEHLPQIHLVEPEGTYLIWLDCSALELTDQALDDLMAHKAGLWLDGGTMFGAGGESFQRINIACRRETLQDAMQRLKKAVDTL